MKNQYDLTEGSVRIALLRFSFPLLAANLIQALYGAVDMFVIGRYAGPESVAAVASGTQVTQIISSVITGLTLAGMILVGTYAGRKREEEIQKTVGTLLSLSVLVSVILTFGMILSAKTVLGLLKTPPEAFSQAKLYVVICSLGIFFLCGYQSVHAVLRGTGDSKGPMLLIALSCLFNVAGDLLFTGGFGWGVAGVAAATAGSQGVCLLCSLWYLYQKKGLFDFRPSRFRIDSRIFGQLAKTGLPISFQECMVRLSFLYLTSQVNRLGVYASSAVGVAGKYDVFAMLPAVTAANALAAVTAQNMGAGKPERAKKFLREGLLFACLMSSAFWFWAQISPETMIGIFTKDPQIMEAGIPFFRTCSYDYLAVSLVFCMNGYLNGRSQTFFTMVSCCFGALALRMPLIYLAQALRPDNLGLIGAVAPAVSGFMALYTLVYLLWVPNGRRKNIL